jgi:hypothetical protein
MVTARAMNREDNASNFSSPPEGLVAGLLEIGNIARALLAADLVGAGLVASPLVVPSKRA